MDKDILNFQKIISKCIVKGKGVSYTHTDCGPPYKKYNITDKNFKKFQNSYSKVLGKINLHITEKPKDISCFTIDIDYRFRINILIDSILKKMQSI